jgi:hypothetical protein
MGPIEDGNPAPSIHSTIEDQYWVEHFGLGTNLGFYLIGIAPNPRLASQWVSLVSYQGTGTLYGGVSRGSVGFVATPPDQRLTKAFFAERRRVAACALAMPAASGVRTVWGNWHGSHFERPPSWHVLARHGEPAQSG